MTDGGLDIGGIFIDVAVEWGQARRRQGTEMTMLPPPATLAPLAEGSA